MNDIKVKVCGLKFPGNFRDVEKLPADYMGFIFYLKSKRYAGSLSDSDLSGITKPKVAVFVDENPVVISDTVEKYRFEFVQLHGSESPLLCSDLMEQGVGVIKAFNIDSDFDFNDLADYEGKVNYFLFDTKSDLHGGSGKKFNWELLKGYSGSTPFFLSGGIGPSDALAIREFHHPKFYGVDLNSGFEDEPGLKNIDSLREFIAEITGKR